MFIIKSQKSTNKQRLMQFYAELIGKIYSQFNSVMERSYTWICRSVILFIAPTGIQTISVLVEYYGLGALSIKNLSVAFNGFEKI